MDGGVVMACFIGDFKWMVMDRHGLGCPAMWILP